MGTKRARIFIDNGALMVVSQFSLQARKEAILRKSPYEFLNANRGLLTWSLSVPPLALPTFLSIQARFKDDGSEATRALLRK